MNKENNVNSSIDIDKQELEEDIAILTGQRTAIRREARHKLNQGDKFLLEKQAEDLSKQIKEKESKLQELENSQNDSNQASKIINQIISSIDYEKARCQINNVYEKLQENGGEALFFIDNFNVVAGKYFIFEIIDKLQSQGNDFKLIEIDIEKQPSQPDEWGLIQNIGEYFNVQDSPFETEECIRHVINVICNSLQNDKTIVLDIRNWDILYDSENLLNFFFNDFWLKLIDKKKSLSNFKNIKLLTIISASIPVNYTQNSIVDKIAKLEINTPWEKTYIEKWLAKNHKFFKLASRQEITKLATRIYLRANKGTPCLICDYLYEELEKISCL